MRKNLTIFYKVFFALLVLFAVAFQYISDSARPDFSSVNFFSYFTIESNIFVAFVFLLGALFLLRKKTSPIFDLVRGASTLYIVITGIVYVILLASLSDPHRIVWVNFTLHYLMPAAVLFDWVFDSPSNVISFRKTLLWLIYPLIYVVYSLIRGPLSGWYPYPFLNPNGPDGVQTVVTYTIVISLGVIIGSFLISKLGNLVTRISG